MSDHPGSPSRDAADVVELHKSLIGIPSLSHEEGPMMDFVCTFLEDQGVLPRRIDNNVWFELGTGDNVLLLATHLDVVPPSEDHLHQYPL